MFISLNIHVIILNSKILIIIGIVIVVGLGIVAISANENTTNLELDDFAEEEESKPKVVQRGLTESVGVSTP